MIKIFNKFFTWLKTSKKYEKLQHVTAFVESEIKRTY